ncbi:MAG: hypothetical protein V1882_02845 [Candidatus Omnitrophota bacterium]
MKTWVNEARERIQDIIRFRETVLEGIQRKDPGRIGFTASLRDVKNVVIIASSSRSGSSLLFSILKDIPSFYSLSGENVPFYKLNRLLDDTFGSDEVPEGLMGADPYLPGLSRDLLSDFAFTELHGDIFTDQKIAEVYWDDLTLRFPLQWPGIRFSLDILSDRIRQAFDTVRKSHPEFCKETFYLELLWLLKRDYSEIDPYYYDIPAERIAGKFPGLPVPSGPPDACLAVEEPPFILLSPRRKACRADLSDKTLLLKTSLDCYRLPLIESLMPQAAIKIIHLTRNPAASVNGLCDGWMHRGFFSHNLKIFLDQNKNGHAFEKLGIQGYSDKYEWGKWWWNFELPPGWQDYSQRPLEEVCAFQWHSAHTAIRAYLNTKKKAYCVVKCENILEDLRTRMGEMEKIVDFLGVEREFLKGLKLDLLRVVHATEAPSFFRWKKRGKALTSVVKTPPMNEMSAQLGYDPQDMENWL